MEPKILNTSYRELLKKSIEVYDKQHQAISQNVANVNNDTYRRVNTDFSEDLKVAMDKSGVKTTRDKHISGHRHQSGSSPSSASKKDEPVDLGREMTDLTINQIRHEFTTRALARHYSGISSAIIGRNR
jgi:flagellar basal-body rod protein FlgB